MRILSNNPRVISAFSQAESIKGSASLVLEFARKYIHVGFVLFAHPLAGNARLCRNPYRSVVLDRPQNEVCARSVLWIDDAIERLSRGQFDSDIAKQDDYSFIDYDLLLSTIRLNIT
ncbi:GrdX family protein [Aminobacterium mobile]